MGEVLGVVVAVAGGLGAATRFALDGVITTRVGRGFPVATLVINVIGSFLLGALTGWHPSSPVRLVVGVGFLGGFTTFSTASVELVGLVRSGRVAAACGLALAMLAVSLAAATAGMVMTGWLVR